MPTKHICRDTGLESLRKLLLSWLEAFRTPVGSSKSQHLVDSHLSLPQVTLKVYLNCLPWLMAEVSHHWLTVVCGFCIWLELWARGQGWISSPNTFYFLQSSKALSVSEGHWPKCPTKWLKMVQGILSDGPNSAPAPLLSLLNICCLSELGKVISHQKQMGMVLADASLYFCVVLFSWEVHRG